jgi:5'-nucleotidase
MMNDSKPTILVTNDDGIFAPGLRKLIDIVRPLGNVAVLAPDKTQSGMSHAVTVSTPLRMRRIVEEDGYLEYSCSGTPADAVKLGQKVLLGRKPDLVLSGINHGSNASINILYSGTMAAALEAAVEGIPAVGFSLLDYSMKADFNGVESYIETIVTRVLQNGLTGHACLNVNIPAIPAGEIKGIRICKQARGKWEEEFVTRKDPHDKDYYWLAGVFVDGDTDPDTDAWALANGYISVVPVHVDLTAHHLIGELRKWGIEAPQETAD